MDNAKAIKTMRDQAAAWRDEAKQEAVSIEKCRVRMEMLMLHANTLEARADGLEPRMPQA